MTTATTHEGRPGPGASRASVAPAAPRGAALRPFRSARPAWRWLALGCVIAGAGLAALDAARSSGVRIAPTASTASAAPTDPSAGPGSPSAHLVDGDPDGDGVPSVSDALPFLDTEVVDTDGDGFGDSQDRFPHDPSRARPVELLVNGTFDAGSDGWSAEPGAGSAKHAAYAGLHGGALGLVSIDADDPPAWTGERIELEPDTVGLRVSVAVRGRSGVELRFEVRHRDPVGTSTVVRSLVLPAAGDDGWHVHEASVALPSRALSVAPSIVSTGGATLVDDLSLHAERATDTDGDGVEDRLDPDDDDDGYADGEDPAPLDASVGPEPKPAHVAGLE